MGQTTSKRVQSYNATLRPLCEDDIVKAHELSIGVGWPHRPEDWLFLTKLGQGFVACDEIERVIGSAMWFPMAEGFATVGMVITSPRLQAMGAGRWLMDHVLEHCGGRDLRLNATRAAYRLYVSLGFQSIGKVYQHQGRARAPAAVPLPRGARLRRIVDQDREVILDLDRRAYGVARPQVLDALLACSQGVLLECDGAAQGYALSRQFGRGWVIGPMAATDSAAAMALAAPLVEQHVGNFLRLDTPLADAAFRAFLNACGMTEYDKVTPMKLGNDRPSDGTVECYALASQALG